MDGNPGFLRHISRMDPAEYKNFMANPYSENPASAEYGSSWFTRVGIMAKEYNTLNLLSGRGDVTANNMVEPGYVASQDKQLKKNQWIEKYYPEAWRDLLESKSSVSTRRRIDKIRRIHPSNMKLAEGSVIGNLMAALPAAVIDPINWIPIGGWVARGVMKLPASTMSKVTTKMAVSSIENTILTMGVEPLMQEHDLTRTEEDFLYDLFGSAALGVVFPLGVHGAKKGLKKTKEKAEKAILGGRTTNDFIEEETVAIQKGIDEKIAEDPEAKKVFDEVSGTDPDTGKQKPFMPEDPDLAEKAAPYLREIFDKIHPGAADIIGGKSGSRLSRFLIRFLRLNPSQRLLFNMDEQTREIGRILVRSNMIPDDIGMKSGKLSLEEVMDYVEQQLSQRQMPLRNIAKEYLEFQNKNKGKIDPDNIINTEHDLYELAGKLIVSTKHTIEEAKGWNTPAWLKKHDGQDQDPFKILENNPEATKAVEELAKEARKFNESVWETLHIAGFESKQNRDVDYNVFGDQDSYVPRVPNNEAIALAVLQGEQSGLGERGNPFIVSIRRGLTEQREANLEYYRRVLNNADEEIEDIELALKQEVSPRDEGTLKKRLELLKKKQESATKLVEDFKSKDWEETTSWSVAKQVAVNMERSPFENGDGNLSSSPSQLLRRKVIIDDRYLVPWKENNIIRLNERTGHDLVRKLIMAQHMARLEDNFRYSQKLSGLLNELEELRNTVEAGGDIDKTVWSEKADELASIVELMEVANQARYLEQGDLDEISTGVKKILKQDYEDEFIKTVSDLRTLLNDLSNSKGEIRIELAKAAGELTELAKETERLQGPIIRVMREYFHLRKKLEAMEEPTEFYETTLVGNGYIPVNNKGEPFEIVKTKEEIVAEDLKVTRSAKPQEVVTLTKEDILEFDDKDFNKNKKKIDKFLESHNTLGTYPIIRGKELPGWAKKSPKTSDYLNKKIKELRESIQAEEFQVRELGEPQPNRSGPGEEHTLTSGGAMGADAMFGEVAEKYGVEVKHFFIKGVEKPKTKHRKGTDRHGQPLEFVEVDVHPDADKAIEDAAARLNRKPPSKRKRPTRPQKSGEPQPWDAKEELGSKPVVRSLIERNYNQVVDADAVFAVGFLERGKVKVQKKGKDGKWKLTEVDQPLQNVEGGTGWAVAMAQGMNKPVFVFDIETNQWYKWHEYKRKEKTIDPKGTTGRYGVFKPFKGVPKLTKKFAGIGSRPEWKNPDGTIKRKGLTYRGVKAIENLFKESFGEPPKKKTVKSPKKIQMSSDWGEGRTLGASKKVKSKSMFDAVIAGEKTAVSSPAGWMKDVRVGDEVILISNDRRELTVVITGKRKASDVTPEEWAKAEGYAINPAKRNWTEGKKFSEYDQLLYTSKPSTKKTDTTPAPPEPVVKEPTKITKRTPIRELEEQPEWEYRANSKGSLTIHVEIDGKSKRGKVMNTRWAKGTGDNRNIDFSPEKKQKEGKYILVGDRFFWINPIKIHEGKIEALNKRIGDRDTSYPEASKARKKLLEETDKKKSNIDILEGTLKKRIGIEKKIIQERLDLLEKVKENRTAEIVIDGKTVPIDTEARSHFIKTQDAYGRFHKHYADYMKKIKDLNKIAELISGRTHSRKDLPNLGVQPRKYIDPREIEPNATPPEGGSMGFSPQLRSVDIHNWWEGSFRNRVKGPGRELQKLGIRGLSEYEYLVVTAANARRDQAYMFTTPVVNVMRAQRSQSLNPDADAKNFKATVDDLTFVHNQLLGRSALSGKHIELDKVLRILKNTNYMRYMGMVTISSLSDFGNAVGTLGMGRYIRTLFHYIGSPDRKNISELARHISAFETLSPSSRGALLAGVETELSHIDYISRPERAISEELGVGGRGKLDKVDDLFSQGGKMMDIYNRLNLLNRWNAFNKGMITLGLEDMVVEMGVKLNKGGKVNKRDLALARAIGFSESDLKQIGKNWSAGSATTRKTIIGRDFYVAHAEKWNDDLFLFDYQSKIKGAVNNIIVTPSVGSLPIAFRSSRAINLMMQFKSFHFASFDMTFLPWLQRGFVHKDPNQLMMMVATATFGGLTAAIYEFLRGKDPFVDGVKKDDDGKVVARIPWAQRLYTAGVDRSGMFALFFEVQNIIERQTGYGFHALFLGKLDAKYRARTLGDLIGGPTGGLGSDFLNAMSWLGEDEWMPSQGKLSSLRRIIPYQNLILAKIAFDVGPSVLEHISTGRPLLAGYEGYSSYRNPNPSASNFTFKKLEQRLAGE